MTWMTMASATKLVMPNHVAFSKYVSVINWTIHRHLSLIMGVNYGKRGTSPPGFGVGDDNANGPADFLKFQHFKDQIACITMQYKAYCPH